MLKNCKNMGMATRNTESSSDLYSYYIQLRNIKQKKEEKK